MVLEDRFSVAPEEWAVVAEWAAVDLADSVAWVVVDLAEDKKIERNGESIEYSHRT